LTGIRESKHRRHYRRHRLKILERLHLRIKTNPMPQRLASRRWRAKNKARVSAYNHEYGKRKPDKMREKSLRWRRLNPEKWREIQRRVKNNMVARAADSYIRDLLNKKNPVKPIWPADFIELKRAELQLKRLCLKSRTTTN